MNTFLIILCKDLMIEWRTRARFASMLIFGVLVVVIFYFAVGVTVSEQKTHFIPGLLWMAILFASMIGLNRSFALEMENDAISGLALAPTDRGFIFLGKASSTAILLFSNAVLISTCFSMGFGLSLLNIIWPYLGTCALASIGIATLGTLFSGMTVRTSHQEILLPILLLPLLVPVLLGAVGATTSLLIEQETSEKSLRLLVVSDAVYLVLSFLTFEFVLED